MKKNLIIGGVAAIAAAVITKSNIEKSRAIRRDFVKTRHKVLIVGATSAIAQETAKRFAEEGNDLFLVARNEANLNAVADDLRARGANKVETAVLDLNELSEHTGLLEQVTQSLGGLDIALIAHGTLGDQEASQSDFDIARQELKTNFLSIVSLLTLIAAEKRRHRRCLIGGGRSRARQQLRLRRSQSGRNHLLARLAQSLEQGRRNRHHHQTRLCGHPNDRAHRKRPSLRWPGCHCHGHLPGHSKQTRRGLPPCVLVRHYERHPAYSGGDFQKA